jgi:hypothetical protein
MAQSFNAGLGKAQCRHAEAMVSRFAEVMGSRSVKQISPCELLRTSARKPKSARGVGHVATARLRHLAEQYPDTHVRTN